MSDFFGGFGVDFLPMLSEILKEPFSAQPVPDVQAVPALTVLFEVGGDARGTLAVDFFQPSAAARRFLQITIGDPEGAGEDESCQEIGNQLIGRLLGALSERGGQIEINYPGKVVKGRPAGAEGFRIVAAGQAESSGLLALAARPDVSAQVPQTASAPGAPALRVLIVDDSPVMCAFLEKIFLDRGYEVVGKAADGVEALEMFQKLDPDLVTLDIVMPKLKGTEVLQRILQIRPDAAVVMASSVSDARTVMKCLQMGARRYIVKPYDKQAVIGAVEKALGMSGGA